MLEVHKKELKEAQKKFGNEMDRLSKNKHYLTKKAYATTNPHLRQLALYCTELYNQRMEMSEGILKEVVGAREALENAEDCTETFSAWKRATVSYGAARNHLDAYYDPIDKIVDQLDVNDVELLAQLVKLVENWLHWIEKNAFDFD